LRYYHKDALGSVDIITNIDAEIVSRSNYLPFGKREITQLSSDVVEDELRRGFGGQEHMSNSSLVDMKARMYDNNIARFVSPDNYIQDPNQILSYNRYVYTMNNPLKYNDPTGHFWQFIIGAAYPILAVKVITQ